MHQCYRGQAQFLRAEASMSMTSYISFSTSRRPAMLLRLETDRLDTINCIWDTDWDSTLPFQDHAGLVAFPCALVARIPSRLRVWC